MLNELWDAVIVGAGPAGSVSAALLAERGWRVLLLERSSWPREKVCGGCINAAGIAILRKVGLGRALRSAHPLGQFSLNVRGKCLHLPLPSGAAISREVLDAALVEEATQRGCVFSPGTAATLLPADSALPTRTIRITRHATTQDIQARVVLACDGIAGTLLENEPWAKWRIAPDSWFGVGATLEDASDFVPRNTIGMNVSRGGYVGTARYADGRLHLAAAMSVDACRSAGGPNRMAASILHDCGFTDTAPLAAARFHGTGLLTRKRTPLGGYRVLAVGDACGYVEPFTGEGIAWAIRGATQIVQLLPPSVEAWLDELPARWLRRHRTAIGARQFGCALLRQALHRPALGKVCLQAATLFPALSALLAQRVGQQSFSLLPRTQGAGE
jgi:flavin-dependent dehydrogenase